MFFESRGQRPPFAYDGKHDVAVPSDPPQPNTLGSEPRLTQAAQDVESSPLRVTVERVLSDAL